MSKAKVVKKWRLSNRDYNDLQRALGTFANMTVESVLEEWFPELAGRRWGISPAGVVSIYEG